MRLILSRCRSGEGGGGACCCVCLLAAACARVLLLLLLLLLLCLCLVRLLPAACCCCAAINYVYACVGGRRVAYVARQNYLGTSCARVCVCVCVCVCAAGCVVCHHLPLRIACAMCGREVG
jgi:hypothetical protein